MRASRELRKSRKFSAIALATIVGLWAVPSMGRVSSTDPDPFSGAWQVTVSPDSSAAQAGQQVFEDEVLFEDGKMCASACSSYGFGPAEYSLGESGRSFITEMSLEGESIKWAAIVQDGRLNGVVIWTKSDGHVYHYTLSGSRLISDAGSSSGSGGSSSD